MGVYEDLQQSIGEGVRRTAEDYFTQAKDKFLIRLGKRKPKTDLERNIGRSYGNTESGRAAQSDYISARLREIFSKNINVYIAIGILSAIALLISRR